MNKQCTVITNRHEKSIAVALHCVVCTAHTVCIDETRIKYHRMFFGHILSFSNTQRSVENRRTFKATASTNLIVKKMSKVTQRQKDLLADLMSENYLILFGKFSGGDGKSVKSRKWIEITDRLNAIGPPSKDSVKWKRVSIQRIIRRNVSIVLLQLIVTEIFVFVRRGRI